MKRLNRGLLVFLILAAMFLLLAPLAGAPLTERVRNESQICQLEYAGKVTADWQYGFEVVRIFPGMTGGRLGALRFEVGDVILQVGDEQVLPGGNLDTLVRIAMMSGNRTVRVIDVRSGRVTGLFF